MAPATKHSHDHASLKAAPRPVASISYSPPCTRATYPMRDIVNHDNTVRAPVVGARDSAEALLTRRVPLHRSNFERGVIQEEDAE